MKRTQLLAAGVSRHSIDRRAHSGELHRKHRSIYVIGHLLGEDEPGYTRSEAERRMRTLMRSARLPAPVANARVAGRSVDFMWREQRLVVEVDSYQYHGHRAAFERDRRKDVALRAAGYRVVRITWWQVRDEPFVVVAHIARILERVT